MNVEIGVVQPLAEIARRPVPSPRGSSTPTPRSSVGKIPIDVDAMKIDCPSISGHKMYGPKGIGAIYVRRRPRLRMEALISAERGAGKSAAFAGAAAGCWRRAGRGGRASRRRRCAATRRTSRAWRSASWTASATRSARTRAPERATMDVIYPGKRQGRTLYGFVEGESLLMGLKEIAVSSPGSACTSASLEPALRRHRGGVDEELLSTRASGIRPRAVQHGGGGGPHDAVALTVEHSVCAMSPLWEMVRGGRRLEVHPVEPTLSLASDGDGCAWATSTGERSGGRDAEHERARTAMKNLRPTFACPPRRVVTSTTRVALVTNDEDGSSRTTRTTSRTTSGVYESVVRLGRPSRSSFSPGRGVARKSHP